MAYFGISCVTMKPAYWKAKSLNFYGVSVLAKKLVLILIFFKEEKKKKEQWASYLCPLWH